MIRTKDVCGGPWKKFLSMNPPWCYRKNEFAWVFSRGLSSCVNEMRYCNRALGKCTLRIIYFANILGQMNLWDLGTVVKRNLSKYFLEPLPSGKRVHRFRCRFEPLSLFWVQCWLGLRHVIKNSVVVRVELSQNNDSGLVRLPVRVWARLNIVLSFY